MLLILTEMFPSELHLMDPVKSNIIKCLYSTCNNNIWRTYSQISRYISTTQKPSSSRTIKLNIYYKFYYVCVNNCLCYHLQINYKHGHKIFFPEIRVQVFTCN